MPHYLADNPNATIGPWMMTSSVTSESIRDTSPQTGGDITETKIWARKSWRVTRSRVVKFGEGDRGWTSAVGNTATTITYYYGSLSWVANPFGTNWRCVNDSNEPLVAGSDMVKNVQTWENYGDWVEVTDTF